MSDSQPSLLPSQQVLLERLKYLIEYGDHAILLHGQPGVGKSTLAQSLLGSSEGFNQGMVTCPPQADPAQLRVEILHQLFSDPLFDPHEPLIDSLDRLLGESQQRLLLVIDDAHSLPQVILAELLAMLLEQGTRSWRLTLVLVSRPKLVQHLLAELPAECQQHLLPVSIEPLSVGEQKQLYRALTADRPLSRFINQLAVEPLLQRSDGSAQAVLDLVTGKGEESPARVGLLRHRNLILALLGLVSTMVLWIVLDPLGPEADSGTRDRSGSVRLVEVAPGLAEQPSEPSAVATETAVKIDNGEPLGLAGEWQAINTPQPKLAPKPEDPLLQSAREGLVDLELQLVAKQAADKSHKEVEPESQTQEPEPELDGRGDQGVSPEPQPEPKSKPAPEVRVSLAEQPLKERPGDSYTLQLAVYSTPKLAAQYLRQLPLKKGVAFYVNNRQPRPWYVVVYGGFKNKAAAKAAVSSLPEAVRKNSPYVKPAQDVQKELVEQLDLAAFLSEYR